MVRLTLLASLVTLFAGGLSAQTTPGSDPQALTFAAQAITGMTGNSAISDVTLIANTSRTAGSDFETGTATLSAKGRTESRLDLSLSGGNRSEIRNNASDGMPQGVQKADSSTSRASAFHNCWTDASWFFPPLSALAATSDPTLIFSYVGQESRWGTSVQHIRVSRYLAGRKPGVITPVLRLSTMHFYLDSASLLPLGVAFYTHPEDNADRNIFVQIRFSDYQVVQGIKLPMHIQKFISGGLALDIAVTSATLNSGLPDSVFSVQ